MSRLTYRGDAPDVAQQTLLPHPPAGFSGSITIGISNKSIELDAWDPAAVVSAWQSAGFAEFNAATASTHADGVLLTASSPGIPFAVWISYGGTSTFNETLLLSRVNWSGSVSGQLEFSFLGDSVLVDHDFDAAELKTALESLDGFEAGEITVSVYSPTQYRIEFGGQWAGRDVPALSIDDSALRGGTAAAVVSKLRDHSDGQNEIQRIVIGGAPTGGSLTFGLNRSQIGEDAATIGPIAWNADETAWQSAFDTGLGVGNADVTFVEETEGETGPLQKVYLQTQNKDDDGFVLQDGSGFTNEGKLALGLVDGERSTMFVRFSHPEQLVPAGVAIEFVSLVLKTSTATPGASISVSCRAAKSPEAPAPTSFADLQSMTLTTAAAVAQPEIVNGQATLVFRYADLIPVIQEVVDAEGPLGSILLVFETQAGSTGTVWFHPHSEPGYDENAANQPKLELHYRDAPGGAQVIDVEFLADLGLLDLPLMTCDASQLEPVRGNTTWRIRLASDTGAPGTTPGVLQLYDDATLFRQEGSNDSPVVFEAAAVAIFDAYFGEGNYELTIASNYDVEIELVGELAGVIDLPIADLQLYWTPILDQEPVGDPVARIELINDGSGAIGEQQRLQLSATPRGGTLAVRLGSQVTSELSHDFDADDLQAALEALGAVGAGNVVCSGSPTGGVLCEFSAALGNVAELQVVNNLRVVGVRLANQQITEHTTTGTHWETEWVFQREMSSPSMSITLGGQSRTITAPTLAGAEAELETRLRELLPSVFDVLIYSSEHTRAYTGEVYQRFGIILQSIGNQLPTPTLNAPHRVDLDRDQPIGEVTQTTITTTIGVEIQGTPTSGSWQLSLLVDGSPSDVINVPANATAAALQQLLAAALPNASCSVTLSGAAYAITIAGPQGYTAETALGTLAGSGVSVTVETVRPYEAIANERQRLIIDGGQHAAQGHVVLRYGGSSRTLYYPWALSDIEYAIGRLTGLDGNVRVTVESGTAFAWRLEFINARAGENVELIAIESHLEPYDETGYQTAVWSLIRTGGNGGSVIVTERQKGSPAVGVRYHLQITGSPHFGTYRLTVGGEQTAALAYNANAATNRSAVEALSLVDPGELITTGTTAEGMLFEFDHAVGAVVMTAQNVDLTNARCSLIEFIRGGRRLPRELVRSSGKNHFDDPLNWKVVETGESRIPNSSDFPIFESGRVPCLYGLRQRTTFVVDLDAGELVLDELADFREGQTLMLTSSGTLPAGLVADQAYTVASYDRDTQRLQLDGVVITDLGTGQHTIRLAVDAITHYSRFTAAIGLPRTNAAGYREYLPTALLVGLDPAGQKLITIGEGNGSSSGQLRFDVGDDEVLCEVHKTGGATEVGVPAFTLQGANEGNAFEQFNGDTALGFFEGEEFRFASIRVHSGRLFYGRIVSAAECEFRNLGGTIDGRSGTISGKIASKP